MQEMTKNRQKNNRKSESSVNKIIRKCTKATADSIKEEERYHMSVCSSVSYRDTRSMSTKMRHKTRQKH